MVSLAGRWLWREDSNLRIRDPKSRALPLGHAPPCVSSFAEPFAAGPHDCVHQLASDGRDSPGSLASGAGAPAPGCPAARPAARRRPAARTASVALTRTAGPRVVRTAQHAHDARV